MFAIDEEEVQALRDKIAELGISRLENQYREPKVADGTQWCLLIQEAGKSKSVYCDNQFPEEMIALADFVHGLVIEPYAAKIEEEHVSSSEHRKQEKKLWESIQENR
jgi:hypothetical protein